MIDVKFILFNKLLVLLLIFAFFGITLTLAKIFKKNVSLSTVSGTLKLCIAGLILLFFEVELSAIPIYGKMVKTFQEIVVIICFANFFNYIITDVYMYYRSNGAVPTLLRDIVRLVVFLVLALASLRLIFKIDPSSILTTSAVLTAAIAFAMQNSLSNVVSGLSIQLDKNMKNRSWISLKDKNVSGEVINVGFRYTTVKNFDNHKVIIPNNVVLQNIVHSYGSERDENPPGLTIRIGLDYETPPERAKKIILLVLAGNKNVLSNPAPVVYLSSFGDNSVDYLIRFFVDDYSKKEKLTDEVLSQVWYAVTREGYSFPYPHREIISKPPKPPFVFKKESILNMIKEIDIFSSLPEAELVSIIEKAKHRVYAPGEIIIKQDTEGDSLFLVTKGTVSVFINNGFVGKVKEREVFGEMSLLTGEFRKASIFSDSEVEVLEVTKDNIAGIIENNKDFVENLGNVIAKRELKNIERLKNYEGNEFSKKTEFINKVKKFFGYKEK